jgi:hypothetical protein
MPSEINKDAMRVAILLGIASDMRQAVDIDLYKKIISIKRFVNMLGVEEVIDAVEISHMQCLNDDFVFQYFCGVCWRKIKGESKGVAYE